MGILDHRIFAKKLKQHKNLQCQSFQIYSMYVYMNVCVHTWKGLCMSYLEDGMYVCTCPTWRVVCIMVVCMCILHGGCVYMCACVHTYVRTYHSGTTLR